MEETPHQAYTVGDEVRLEIEIVCEANLESARVFFVHSSRYEGEPGTTFTLYGDVVLDETDPYEERKFRPPLKKFRTELVSLVDDDHTRGIYHLHSIQFQSASGGVLIAHHEDNREGQQLPPLQFQIVSENNQSFRIKVNLVDPSVRD